MKTLIITILSVWTLLARADAPAIGTTQAAVNGMLHLDSALNGLISELRKSGKFAGHALETLLITPKKGTLAAARLLLIGLGDAKQFTPEVLRRVGAVELREVLRLGVTSFSHASDVEDGGVDSPVGKNASALLEGVLDGLRTQRYLADQSAAERPTPLSLILLAGPSFYADTIAAVRKTLD